ncbi:MAG: hypothetical protein ACYDDA_05195 [Acidiferrobacteraceae bacterium]
MRNDGISRIEAQSMIDMSVSKAYADLNNMHGALRNRVFGNATAAGGTLPTTFGAAVSTTGYLLTALTAKVSGIFAFSVDIAATQLATGTYNVQIISYTAAAGTMSITNGAEFGPTNLLPGPGPTGAYVNNGGSLAVAASAGALTQCESGVITQPTAATAWSWGSGNLILHNSVTATAETKFPIGNQVMVLVQIATTAEAITAVSSANIQFYELVA